MTTPQDMEEMLKLPFVKCLSCGKVIGQLRETYKSLTDGGTKPSQAFEQLGLTRQCCKMNLANPSQIAPGLVYHNPRQQGTVQFASQDAARLLGQLSLGGESQKTLSVRRLPTLTGATEVKISPSVAPPKLLGQPVLAKPTVEVVRIGPGRHSSTAVPPGVSIAETTQQPPEALVKTEEVFGGEEITEEHFSQETLQKFRQQSLGPVGGISPLTRIGLGGTPIPTVVPVTQPALFVQTEAAPVTQMPTLPVVRRVRSGETTTENLFLPMTITSPSISSPGEMTIVRQFSGV